MKCSTCCSSEKALKSSQLVRQKWSSGSCSGVVAVGQGGLEVVDLDDADPVVVGQLVGEGCLSHPARTTEKQDVPRPAWRIHLVKVLTVDDGF